MPTTPGDKIGDTVRLISATIHSPREAATCAMADEPRLRLVSDRPKGSDFESFPRTAQCPRYRQRENSEVVHRQKEKPPDQGATGGFSHGENSAGTLFSSQPYREKL